jgi:hypothetical protein
MARALTLPEVMQVPEKRMPVGGRLGHVRGRDCSRRSPARPVLDDHRLPWALGQALRDHSRVVMSAALPGAVGTMMRISFEG